MPTGERDKKLIDAFPEALLLVEKQGQILSANKAALELLGQQLERLVGRHLSDLVTDSSQLNPYLRACSRTAQFHIGSFQLRTDSDKLSACRFDGALLRWTGENVLLVRLTPRAHSSTPFVSLNEQIEGLNRARHGLENEVRTRTAQLLDAQTKLQELSAQLMRAQDEERRRIARELHDSTGQTLTAIQLQLSVLLMNDFSVAPENRARVEQLVELTNDAMGEIRTISHLLHPPMLDEAGLCMALRTFIEGFEERSRIAVAVDLPARTERLSPDTETALFRIVQECLTNVHRHSGSKDASIRLAWENGCVVLEIADVGRGMSVSDDGCPQKAGVGIRGMQERVRLLNGVMEFIDASPGTLVRVKLPCPTGGSREPGVEMAATKAGIDAN